LLGWPTEWGLSDRRLEVSPTAHVFLDDGAAGAGSLNGTDIDSELRRHATRQWG
jgi:hypothetical protein